MADAVDPFTQTYDAVWTALRAHTPFSPSNPSALLRIGNQGDLTGNAAPLRKSVGQAADFTVAWLMPSGFAMAPFGSNSRVADLSQTLQLVTATERPTDLIKLNQVKYQTFVALAKAGPDLGMTRLCRNWNITGGIEGIGQNLIAGVDITQGKNGLVSILTITVEMCVDRAALIAS